MGNLEINTSMKTLDFEARTAVAKECIHRLCGIPGARSADTNTRKSDPRYGFNEMPTVTIFGYIKHKHKNPTIYYFFYHEKIQYVLVHIYL